MQHWFTFLITCLVLELTPGPNMAYLALLSVREGKRAGFAAVAGIAAGLATLGALAAFGAASLVAAQPSLAKAISWAGFLYLLWLAWDSWRSEDRAAPTHVHPSRYRRFFGRGLLTNLLNPKAFLFYAITLPALVSPHASLLLTLGCVGISVLIATAVHIAVVLLGSHYQRWLLSSRYARSIRRFMALLLVAIGFWFAMTNHLLG